MHDKTKILLKGARNRILLEHRNTDLEGACYTAVLENLIDRLVCGIERGKADDELEFEVNYAKD